MQLQRISRAERGDGFEVLAGTARSQAAIMAIEPGRFTRGPENRPPESDQWLFVLEGSGRMTVEEKEIEVEEGHLVLIETGCPAVFQAPKRLENEAKRKPHFRFASRKMPRKAFFEVR